jgi:CO/xanthine dehydrogenase Mo-binding subunit
MGTAKRPLRVTGAVYTIERMTDILAQELETDSAELRLKNFIADAFPLRVTARQGVRQPRRQVSLA